MTFDLEATFGDDYLYFYEESIDDEHSDADTAEILGLLDLPAGLPHPRRALRPRPHRPAAGRGRHGGDRRRPDAGLPRAGAGRPAAAPGRGRRTSRATSAHLPVDGPFDAVVCWLNSFGYYDDADCHRVLARVPPGPPARRHGGDRHHAPRRRRAALHPGTRRGGRPARRRHHGRGLDLRPGDGAHGDRAHRRTGTARVRHASYFVRLPTPPEWVVWLEAAGFRDVRVPGRRRWPARARQLGDGGRRHGLRPRTWPAPPGRVRRTAAGGRTGADRGAQERP